MLGHAAAQQDSNQQRNRQNDAVPVNAVADVNGHGVRVDLPIPEEAGKADGHIR